MRKILDMCMTLKNQFNLILIIITTVAIYLCLSYILDLKQMQIKNSRKKSEKRFYIFYDWA